MGRSMPSHTAKSRSKARAAAACARLARSHAAKTCVGWVQIFANFKMKVQKSSKVPRYKIQSKYQNMTFFMLIF